MDDTLTVQIDASQVIASTDALGYALSETQLLKLVGRSVMNTVRENFDYLESTRPNKLGGEREHYFSQARRATMLRLEGDVAVISVAQVGIRMKYFGGTIRPGVNASSTGGGNTRYLTIPAIPEAYGRRASEFDLQVAVTGGGKPFALVLKEERKSMFGRGVQSTIYFWLVEEVNIEADPTILPESEEISEEVVEDFEDYVNAAWKRSGQAPNP